MRFWDSSAIIPLLFFEDTTPFMQGLLERDVEMGVWWATAVECVSAVERARRNLRISPEDALEAGRRLAMIQKTWSEIHAVEEVRSQAKRLLRAHPLRAADALQLGAAIVWSGRSDQRELVTLDAGLREAARVEGFNPIPVSGLDKRNF